MLSRGVGVVTGLVAIVASVLTACGGTTTRGADPTPSDPTVSVAGSPSGPSSGTTAGTDPSTPAGSSSVIVADPSHAVPAPGPRTGDLYSADLLVWSPRTIDPATIGRIRHTRGVTHVEPMSMAQVSVEDRLVKVIAADPATYRDFTPLGTADTDAVWDRVAGGELAVDRTSRAAVPPDADGYVRLGSEKDAPEVHVGAYLDQVPGLADAVVVNQRWGAAMGIARRNALLVSTTVTAPDRVRRPLQRIVGSKVSIQRLDVVARAGIDLHAAQTAYVVGSVADAVGRYTYTVVGGGRIAPDPSWVAAHITTEAVPILGSVTCNRLMFPQLRAALQEVVDQGLTATIHSTAGCYNARFIAGTHTLSNHAFGLAIDINAPENQRGTVGQMDRRVVAIFQKWGFTWGGTWHYTDPMHFEMNRLVRPG
jgi:hypothetical protein